MTILNVIGWVILASPFVAIFAFLVKDLGWANAGKIFAGIAVLYSVLWLGITLTGVGS